MHLLERAGLAAAVAKYLVECPLGRRRYRRDGHRLGGLFRIRLHHLSNGLLGGLHLLTVSAVSPRNELVAGAKQRLPLPLNLRLLLLEMHKCARVFIPAGVEIV